jgi:signal peptidase I
MPAHDGDPSHMYVSYRDDFPQDLEGISAQASANHAATWAAELPSHIQGDDLVVPDGMVFAMGVRTQGTRTNHSS